MKTAEQIYDEAIARSNKDHLQMCEDWINSRIEVCTPCGRDRDRKYVIEAFQKAIDALTSG